MVKIDRAILENFPLLLPPLPEQREIAAILSSVDDTIKKTQALVDQLDVVKNALRGELLAKGIPGRHVSYSDTDIGRLPSGWRAMRLGELADFINGRAFKPSDWRTKGAPIVRIQNLNGGTDFNYYSGEIEPRFALVSGDLLFSWSGTRGTSFGPHIWRGPAGVLNQHIFNVRNLRSVSKIFFYYALKWVTAAVEKRAHGGTGIVHITKGDLESFVIPVPSAGEQDEISEGLQAIDDSYTKNIATLTELRQIKRALLDALLSGSLSTNIQPLEAA